MKKKKAANITKYSYPHKDINVPTKTAAKAPPMVNIFVLIEPKKIIAIINSKIMNSIDIYFLLFKLFD